MTGIFHLKIHTASQSSVLLYSNIVRFKNVYINSKILVFSLSYCCVTVYSLKVIKEENIQMGFIFLMDIFIRGKNNCRTSVV